MKFLSLWLMCLAMVGPRVKDCGQKGSYCSSENALKDFSSDKILNYSSELLPTVSTMSTYTEKDSQVVNSSREHKIEKTDDTLLICENTSSNVSYLSEFFKQTKDYLADGFVEYNRYKDTISRFDECFKKKKYDSCQTQFFCSCEDDCVIYDNCCYDSRPKTLDQDRELVIRQLYTHSSCENIVDGVGFTMVSSCPPAFANSTIKYKCEVMNASDAFTIVPLYDKELEITFKNSYCAKCHNSGSEILYWDVFIENCPMYFETMWDNNEDMMGNINRVHAHNRCKLVTRPLPAVKVSRCAETYRNEYFCSNYNPRDFFSTYSDASDAQIDTGENSSIWDERYHCNEELQNNYKEPDFNNRTHNYIAYLCQQYQSVLLNPNNNLILRNSICSWCDLSGVLCSKKIGQRSKISFSALINFTAAVGKAHIKAPCEEREIFDTINNICRQLICPGQSIANYGTCLPPYTRLKLSWFTVTFLGGCFENIAQAAKTASRGLKQISNTFNLKWYGDIFDTARSGNISGTLIMSNISLDVCFVLCFGAFMDDELTYEEMLQIQKIFRYPYIEDPMIKGKFVKVENSKIELPCLNSNSDISFDCPHLILNESELLQIKQRATCVYPVLKVPAKQVVSGNYSMCLDDYKRISDIKCDQYKDKEPSLEGLLSLILVSISVVSLIATMFTYIVHPKLRTIPCRICLNIMLMLCVAKLLFILSNVTNGYRMLCYITAVIAHYSWLCVFILMLIYSLNMFHTFYSGIVVKYSSTPRSRCIQPKLAIYLICSHLISILVVSSNLVFVHLEIMDVKYGQPTCFINNPTALLITFGCPVGLVVITNIILFVATTVKIIQFHTTSKSFKPKTNIFLSCIKMTSFLGLAWIFGFAAAFTDFQFLWYVHIIFNGSCGLFIFISHVLCSRMIMRWYKTTITDIITVSQT